MSRTIICMIAILLSTISQLSASKTKISNTIWYDNLSEAKIEAAKTGKKIYIYFTGGARCYWCVKMNKETFSNTEVQKKILKKSVNVMLNVWHNTNSAALTRDKALMKKFSGRGVPFNALLDSKGNKITTFGGFQPASRFMTTMKYINKHHTKIQNALKTIESGKGKTFQTYYALFKSYDKLELTSKAAAAAEIAALFDITNVQKKHAELFCAIANGKIKEKKYKTALKYLKKVHQLDPINKRGFLESAAFLQIQIAIQTNDFSSGLKVFENCRKKKIQLKEKQRFLMNGSALYYWNKQKDKGKILLKEIIKINPSSKWGLYAKRLLQKLYK